MTDKVKLINVFTCLNWYTMHDMEISFHTQIFRQTTQEIRRDLFYLLDYVIRRSEKSRFEKKKKKKLVRRQIDDKFPNTGILLFPWKNVMLLFVKFLTYVIMQCYLIKKSSLANITWVQKITVFYDLFHHVFLFIYFFFLRSPIWKISLGVT